ncbi:YlxQ family RNA-binding protein [Brevibacillus dissolubilis]|uniref:YlxQ family RNA-binding protein n=1 Tax=Brevibacillus dissolubilis TaxID=1844116 RepID=UPI0011170898|nr:YlxQ family RNA-binding protein [Brevibacillus dissolubilis]
MNPKVSNLLGLAMRARKIVTGEGLVVDAVRKGQAKIVLLATDASANTAKKVTDKCQHYQVPCYALLTRYELGQAIGKEARVSIAITDGNFAKNIQELLTPNF